MLLHRYELPWHPRMVTEEDVRRVALSLPGSIERPDNRLPSFRVRNNLFVRIHKLPDTFFARCVSGRSRPQTGVNQLPARLRPGPASSCPVTAN